MLFKILLELSVLYVAFGQPGWNKIASDLCVGAKNNGYREFRYDGATTFTNAMKLVHKKGEVGCVGWSRTKWGCTMPRYQHATNIIVTDTRNHRIYPSPALVSLRNGGWYDLAGYHENSTELVFTDLGFRYMYNGQTFRVWYGEDLYDKGEADNHGQTCMDVYVLS